MNVFGFTSLLILQISAAASSAAVLGGPVIYPASGHLYYLLTANEWVDSENEALTLGGHLVTINDLAENQWVFSTFGPVIAAERSGGDFSPSLWLGLTDAALEGTFTWVSGEPVLFTRWDVGQPNNNGGNQDYVWMRIRSPVTQNNNPGFWNDFGDFPSPRDYFGVVEVVPEPSGLVFIGMGALVLIAQRQRR